MNVISAISWEPWDFDGDVPGGSDARAVVNGIVLEAYDDGSWAVDDETSEGRCTGDDLASAKADCVARLQDGPPYGVNFDALGACDATIPEPIPLLLWCPACGARHVDTGEFETKVHHTHSCQNCGVVWRPAIVATVGVLHLPGFKGDGAAEADNPAEQCENISPEGSLSWGNRCLLRKHALGACVYGTPKYERVDAFAANECKAGHHDYADGFCRMCSQPKPRGL